MNSGAWLWVVEALCALAMCAFLVIVPLAIFVIGTSR